MSEPDDAKPDERRRAERIPINDEFSREATTWVSDLSRGGVFVYGAELLPVGSTIDLRFTVLLDDPVLIEANGRVVRHSRRPPGIGVQFIDLDPAMRARIDEVLDRQRPIDSGKPLRLPKLEDEAELTQTAASDDESEATMMWAKPAPIEQLRMAETGAPPELPNDDDVTRSFPRFPSAEAIEAGRAPVPVFRPPPMPGKGDDERTQTFPRPKG